MSEEGPEREGVTKLEDRVFRPMAGPVLHHVSLFVSDMEASARFYTEGLGLALREEFDDIIGVRGARSFPFTAASVFLEAGAGRFIELHPAGDAAMSPPGFPMNHLALVVADVDAAYAKGFRLVVCSSTFRCLTRNGTARRST